MKAVTGRCFAIIWLLVSTLAVAKAFTYFIEYNIDKRNRNTEKWILEKKLTLYDLLSANLDNDGSIRYATLSYSTVPNHAIRVISS